MGLDGDTVRRSSGLTPDPAMGSFGGHPLRKDWHEPFYEDEAKPFKSRWPEGHIYRQKIRIRSLITLLTRLILIQNPGWKIKIPSCMRALSDRSRNKAQRWIQI